MLPRPASWRFLVLVLLSYRRVWVFMLEPLALAKIISIISCFFRF